jgi:phage-related protein
VIGIATMLICKYYRARDGTVPVKAFIDALLPNVRDKLALHIDRLRELGDLLGYPFTSQVDGELRELRAWFGNRHFRLYYQRSKGFVVLLHIFEKRESRLPAEHTALAKARYRDFKERMDSSRRTSPRPLGADAPLTTGIARNDRDVLARGNR